MKIVSRRRVNENVLPLVTVSDTNFQSVILPSVKMSLTNILFPRGTVTSAIEDLSLLRRTLELVCYASDESDEKCLLRSCQPSFEKVFKIVFNSLYANIRRTKMIKLLFFRFIQRDLRIRNMFFKPQVEIDHCAACQ